MKLATMNQKTGWSLYNPFLTEFREAVSEKAKRQRGFASKEGRTELAGKYAWAVPNDEAIRTIQKEGPIVEIGAGTGYWAYLLRQVGVEVHAYDAKPGHNHWCSHDPWTHVEVGGPEKVLDHPQCTLMLCWPPYNESLAHDCVELYTGTTVVYIGEDPYGCTGDSAYHEYMDRRFKRANTVSIPQWFSINDYLEVWHRK